jgi:hypothetical protein
VSVPDPAGTRQGVVSELVAVCRQLAEMSQIIVIGSHSLCMERGMITDTVLTEVPSALAESRNSLLLNRRSPEIVEPRNANAKAREKTSSE